MIILNESTAVDSFTLQLSVSLFFLFYVTPLQTCAWSVEFERVVAWFFSFVQASLKFGRELQLPLRRVPWRSSSRCVLPTLPTRTSCRFISLATTSVHPTNVFHSWQPLPFEDLFGFCSGERTKREARTTEIGFFSLFSCWKRSKTFRDDFAQMVLDVSGYWYFTAPVLALSYYSR